MSATTLDKFNEVAKMSLGRITLSRTENEFQTHAVHDIIVNHHSYVPTTRYVGRKIDYLIENDGTLIGTIGIGSATLSMGTRDRFIGWDAEQRMKHLVNMCNNYRFTLMPNAPHLAGSRILSELERHIVKDWQEQYHDRLVMIETLVKPPREGTIYRAANWTLVGETKGVQFKWIKKTELKEWKDKGWKKAQDGSTAGFLDKTKISMPGGTAKKLIFVKPLNRAWKRYLSGEIK